jgi:hypothetical protein
MIHLIFFVVPLELCPLALSFSVFLAELFFVLVVRFTRIIGIFLEILLGLKLKPQE